MMIAQKVMGIYLSKYKGQVQSLSLLICDYFILFWFLLYNIICYAWSRRNNFHLALIMWEVKFLNMTGHADKEVRQYHIP